MSSPSDMNAIHEGAALGQIADSRAIAVSGPDRAAYLQGLLTNDIASLTAGTGCYAAWLTAQGRMLTDLHVLESGDMILLDVPSATHAATLARLDEYLFSENVQLADLGEALRTLWVHGPAAPRALDEVTSTVFDFAGWPQYRNARAEIAGTSVVVARIDQLGVPGYCVHADAARYGSVAAALEAAGAVRVTHETLEAARIEAAYPLFGVDMTEDTIPLEAGIQARGISLSKGCYVGQEIIVRVLHRGHGRVARRLAQLVVDDAVPARGSRIFLAEKDVGWVTSAARSPRLGPVALGYLQREVAHPDGRVEIEIDGHRCPATVRVVPGP